MKDKRRSPHESTDSKARPRSLGRRTAIKGLTVAGGAIVASNWTKPIVDTVVLPAHAQATGPFPFVGQGTGQTADGFITIVFA